MKKDANPTSKFSSKVKRINIELPNYKYFHSPSLIDQNDDRFLGRKNIIDKLKNDLTQNEPNTGAYLVTGYRGMGKSSYVNKVLNQITQKNRKWIDHLFLWLLFYLPINILLFTYFNDEKWVKLLVNCGYFSMVFIYYWINSNLSINTLLVMFNTFIVICVRIRNIEWLQYFERKKIKEKADRFLYTTKQKVRESFFRKPRRVVLRLNLGHEILNEKDILSLIAKSIEHEFKRFAFDIRRQAVFYLVKTILLIFLAIQVINTKPIPDSFYNNVFLTQQKEFKIDKIFKIEKYTELINQIKQGQLDKPENNSSAIGSTISNSGNLMIQMAPKDNKDASFFKKAKLYLISVVNLVDIYVDGAFCYLSNEVIRILKSLNIKTNLFPTHLNYLFLLTFFLLNLFLSFCARIILRGNYTRFTSRKIIIRKLRQLNDHINSAVTTENNSGLGTSESKIGLNINQRRANKYPMSDIRQMEKGLIDILDEIDRLVFPLVSPEFIIVFDELDKIDPRSNTNISDKEEELTDFDNTTNGFTGGATTRLRKQNVLKLLANMKYFITTAKAKFIFISGRELYDAFLADVSDREFSISSIFHEVIYVESFLSDSTEKNKSDIIGMTEHYVCQFLMPEWYTISWSRKNNKKSYSYEALTLKCYEDYLCDVRRLKRKEHEVKKTIMLLYQFIHYLTHVSNGAPKKITNLFERYIVSYDCCNKDLDYFVGRKGRTAYLSFGNIDQNKIGFIHYLANPIIMAIVTNVYSYGDKLLVSASFLIDHVYKFHGNGFSWRNLEHAPEILDINRTPELRNFISTIVGYLSQTHISPIVSGLFTFKFPKKISEEISFISKISEEASALFNFTLDESLTIKRHYSKLLQHYNHQYNTEKHSNLPVGEYIHAIADIHHILGDLRLFDEEYTEAIFEYQSCVQYILRNFSKVTDSHQVTHLLFIVRTMLKLGLAFEKRRTFNSAYLNYCELVSMAIDLRYINEKSLGLEYKTENVDGWKVKKAVLFKSNKPPQEEENIFIKEMLPEKFENEEKDQITFMIKGEELIPSLARITTPLKNKLITRLSLFEDIGLMHQALLAKLFVLEKIQLGGISLANLAVIEGEFRNLHLMTNLKEKFLISADFFKKLGDIMYYKNGLINEESTTLFNGLDIWGYDINNDIDNYAQNIVQREKLGYIKIIPFINLQYDKKKKGSEFQKELNQKAEAYFATNTYSEWIKAIKNTELRNAIINAQPEIVNFFHDEGCKVEEMSGQILNKVVKCNKCKGLLLKNRNIAPCYACKYYNRSLKILSDHLLNQEVNDSPKSKAFIFLKALVEPEKFYSVRSNFSQLLASTLGGFGDVMVSCSMNQDQIRPEFLKVFFKYIESNKKGSSYEKVLRYKTFEKSPASGNLSNLEKAILYYLASAKYYKRSSNLKEAHVMYKKILLLLIQFVINDPENRKYIAKHLQDIDEQIVKRILQCIYSAYEHIHVVEIQKLKWINTQEMYELLELNQLSLFPEVEETLYAFCELKLVCGELPINSDESNSKVISIEKLYCLQSLSPFRLNSSIYNRLISIRFKTLLNRKLLENLITDYKFENDVYRADHPKRFYNKLRESLDKVDEKFTLEKSSFLLKLYEVDKKNEDDKKKKVGNKNEGNNKEKHSNKDKRTAFLEIIEHLIVDSIFCFQKFLEMIYPQNKTTLFTNSYVADIYQQLFEWSQLYDFLYMLYAYKDEKRGKLKIKDKKEIDDKKEAILNALSMHYWNRLKANSPQSANNSLNQCFGEIKGCICQFENCGVSFDGKSKPFFEKLSTEIDVSNTQLINSNYLAEQGIKKYQNAFAIHQEGKPYKSMIEDMYYLNDDLDNDSFKFFLALERYRINSGIVEKKMNKLKNLYKNSLLFDVKNYLGKNDSQNVGKGETNEPVRK